MSETISKKGKLTPQTANTQRRIYSLKRDNFETPGFWILVEAGTVTLCEQRNGEEAKAKLTIPKSEFNRLLRFYQGSEE